MCWSWLQENWELHKHRTFHAKLNSTFYRNFGYGGIIDGTLLVKENFEFHMECTIIIGLVVYLGYSCVFHMGI